MRYAWADGFDEPSADTTGERMDVPEGVHEFQIKQVIQHPDKIEYRLVHPDRRYGWVFCRLIDSQRWAKARTDELVAALGMTLDEWQKGEPTDIVGRRIRAEIVHRQSADRLYVNVHAFLPPLAVEDEPKQARRKTVSQKATEALSEQAKDDIPF